MTRTTRTRPRALRTIATALALAALLSAGCAFALPDDRPSDPALEDLPDDDVDGDDPDGRPDPDDSTPGAQAPRQGDGGPPLGPPPDIAAGATASSVLVLHDSTGPYGHVGSQMAIGVANLLGGHVEVTVQPVVDYVTGLLGAHDGLVYLGGTFDEPLPAAFVADVRAAEGRVVWVGNNLAQISGPSGSATNQEFQDRHGFDPAAMLVDDRPFDTVVYRERPLTRYADDGAGVLLVPTLTDDAKATVVATAQIGREPDAESVPWAVHTGGLTFVSENPFSYIDETDRYLVFADLLTRIFGTDPEPSAPRALVRLEDIHPAYDLDDLLEVGAWLHEQEVPFTVGVIPRFVDPGIIGTTPRDVRLSQSPEFVAALRQLESYGGTLIVHGYTHQWGEVANPYDGTSGPDFEFYRARCSWTGQPPYDFVPADADDPCPDDAHVVLLGALPGDSVGWVTSRVDAALDEFAQAGLAAPRIFEFPHYAASSLNYHTLATVYADDFDAVYERRIYPAGLLEARNAPAADTGSQSEPEPGLLLGQFFPYAVEDLYGQRVIPENLGNVIETPTNHHPARTPAQIVEAAETNLLMSSPIASFFYHPYLGLDALRETVEGIQELGYTFVPSTELVMAEP